MAALVALAGCLKVDAPDGIITCSNVPDRLCPEGFYCEPTSRTCWHNGDVPDLANAVDFSFSFHTADLSFPVNDLSVQLDDGDMALPQND